MTAQSTTKQKADPSTALGMTMIKAKAREIPRRCAPSGRQIKDAKQGGSKIRRYPTKGRSKQKYRRSEPRNKSKLKK
jgi:hypothetical protein